MRTRASNHAAVTARLDALSRQFVGDLAAGFANRADVDLEQLRELVRKLQFVEKSREEAEKVEAELDQAH